MATLKKDEIKKLFNRVYSSDMVIDKEKGLNDEKDIKALCQKVFGDGGKTPDPSLLHQFNQLVVEKADEIAKPKVTELIGLLANLKPATRGNVVQIDLPRKIKSRFIWSANGSGVDLIRVEGKKKEIAIPRVMSTGFYYEPLDLVTDSVESFRNLINDLAEAKVRLYMKEIAKLTSAAVSSAKIPTNNQLVGSNNSITDFNKLATRAMRYGGKPMLIADPVMINDLAMKQVTDTNLSKLISEEYKDELLRSLNVTSIGRVVGFNLVNPFIDENNTKVELSVQEGYMLAGEGSQKPFTVVEYGGMRQQTETDIEDERVKIKIAQDASINLIYTSNFFYLKDSALSL